MVTVFISYGQDMKRLKITLVWVKLISQVLFFIIIFIDYFSARWIVEVLCGLRTVKDMEGRCHG